MARRVLPRRSFVGVARGARGSANFAPYGRGEFRFRVLWRGPRRRPVSGSAAWCVAVFGAILPVGSPLR